MVCFLKIHMGVYLRAKFEVSSIILTSFREGARWAILPVSEKIKAIDNKIEKNKAQYN